jgi:hypothetical protein
MELRYSVGGSDGSPCPNRLEGARQEIDPVHQEHRFARDAYVSRVFEDGNGVPNELLVTLVGMLLDHEELVF